MVQATVERETDETVDDDELEGEVDLEKLQAWFPTFRAPIAMRLLLEEKAADAKLNVPQYMKKIVADHIQYALPASTSRGGVQTDEQKKAKLEEYKAKAKAERARVKAILEAERAKDAEPVAAK